VGGSVDGGASGALVVVSVEPAARSLTAAADAPIVIRFDRAVARASVTPKTLWAFGRWSGPVRNGQYAFSDGDRVVTITRAGKPWASGDRVTVVLSHDLQATDGSKLRGAGYSFQFWTATKAPTATFIFEEIERLTTRTDSATTRTYGASASDINGDGYLDLLTINEDSADLRIFLNKGAGGGQASRFHPFVTPPTPLDQRASPSETTDFDGDGIVDLVTANLNANNLSVLFGRNDGTFLQSQKPRVSGEPRGVAVLDADGDGDIDVVNTNADGDNLSLMLNDGAGKFPTTEQMGIKFFDAGHGQAMAWQEFGLYSGDMNEDGILDLVIGARGREMAPVAGLRNSGVVINRGNGDGTFSFASMAGPRTSAWQLAVGDLNGDGHEDVATVDADLTRDLSRNTVTILLGGGAGTLQVGQTYDETGQLNAPFAIDLGDLDGDRDLDIVVSNFRGDWVLLRNNGAGQFTRQATLTAPNAASCALLIDVDNDRDLDLVLIDENADELIVMHQR
jgi:hypothetical protein